MEEHGLYVDARAVGKQSESSEVFHAVDFLNLELGPHSVNAQFQLPVDGVLR